MGLLADVLGFTLNPRVVKKPAMARVYPKELKEFTYYSSFENVGTSIKNINILLT